MQAELSKCQSSDNDLQDSFGNSETTVVNIEDGETIADAVKRIYGVDIRKKGCMLMVTSEEEKEDASRFNLKEDDITVFVYSTPTSTPNPTQTAIQPSDLTVDAPYNEPLKDGLRTFGIVSGSGILTLAGVASYLVITWQRERRQAVEEQAHDAPRSSGMELDTLNPGIPHGPEGSGSPAADDNN